MPHCTLLLLLLLQLLDIADAVATISGLCQRAGGVIQGQDWLDDPVIEWETEEMCVRRGCHFDSKHGECHYPPEMKASNITTVHLIQSNHLDVGYTADAVDVINTYFDSFFPRAIQVGKELRDSGGKERLAWMTQTYLVSLFLSCPPDIGLHCPSDSAVSAFKAAVAAGDITWQAFPHNAELMMLDKSMLEFGVNVTHDIDDLLKQPRKTVVSSRDVPGFDRSIIPVLKKVGIKVSVSFGEFSTVRCGALHCSATLCNVVQQMGCSFPI